MEELRASFELLRLRRKKLALELAGQLRPFTDAEIKELSELNGALSALVTTIADLGAPQHVPPQSQASAMQVQAEQDFRIVANQAYQTQREGHRFSMSLVAEYGKWLIATIAAAQAAGIYLFATADSVDWANRVPSLWALVIGLTMILFAGLATWANWDAHAEFYGKWANVWILVDRNAWPKDQQTSFSRIK